ncbi:MAG: hypothetical protein ACRC3G_02220 [Bacteroidales bacterium]
MALVKQNFNESLKIRLEYTILEYNDLKKIKAMAQQKPFISVTLPYLKLNMGHS